MNIISLLNQIPQEKIKNSDELCQFYYALKKIFEIQTTQLDETNHSLFSKQTNSEFVQKRRIKMNEIESKKISEDFEIYDGKSCVYCGCKENIKKRNVVFKYSYKVRMCPSCIKKLNLEENVITWLEKNAKFDSSGHVYFPKNND